MGEVGVEPTRPFRTLDFKSNASAIPPLALANQIKDQRFKIQENRKYK